MSSTSNKGACRPLEGIRVVAFEHAVAGPICTRHLADLGAEVIKVERPEGGDFARGYDDYVDGNSSYFVWLNRAKRSLALDIKSPAASGVIHRLIERADIVVQNLAPGASSRGGFAYADVSRINNRCVLVDISGYGESGPFAQKKAYDMLVQAEGGFMSVTGTPDTPVRAGISIVDLATGMYAQSAALAALLRRARTGEGSNVKVAMIDALAEWMTHPLYRYAYRGTFTPRSPANHPAITPYGIHAVRGGSVIFSVQNEREWASFCRTVMLQPELAHSEKFCSNSARRRNEAELTALIEDCFSALSPLEVTTLLDEAGIANGRLNDAKGLWEHEQLSGRDKWREIRVPGGKAIRALLPPIVFSDIEAVMGDVPALGQDTTAILQDLGLQQDEILGLHESGAVMTCTTKHHD